MNNEIKNEWILATVKRNLANMLAEAAESGDMEYTKYTLTKVLVMVNTAEADAVLGTQEMVEQYVATLPGGDVDCEACKIEFTEVK